ncbi:MAG: radical SAM protein [Clostridia bacterium]|nr:radical SAM protein [Clostridia bacterium]
MSIIYRPSGMAREYSPYALNIYMGCSHRCKYCYAPHTLQKSSENYFGKPEPRKDILKLLEKDLQKNKYTEQVLLSFVGDCYCDSADNGETVRAVLKMLNYYKVPVAVLSKGGKKMLRDLDLFKEFGDRIMVGTTLTFLTEEKSKEWEPYASTPSERLETLKTLHDNGIKTFASFEPTIEPEESLKLIKKTLELDCVDHYKIGKINNYKSADKWQDWPKYLQDCLDLLRPTNKQVYYKFCLRKLAPNIELTDAEKNPDEYVVKINKSKQVSLWD